MGIIIPCFHDVCLISDNEHGCVLSPVVLDRSDPALQVFEALSFYAASGVHEDTSNVIHDESYISLLEIGRNDGAETLLPGCVPQLDNSRTCGRADALGGHINTDRCLKLSASCTEYVSW